MRRTAFAGVVFALLIWFGPSANAQQYQTIERCIEEKINEINQKIFKLKSKCSDEIRYINNCINNPANARSSKDRARSKGDWLKLRRQVEKRCSEELAALTRQQSEVRQFCREAVGRRETAGLPGAAWEVTETGAVGIWKRRGQSNVFDGKWNDGAVGELTITVRGSEVRVARRDVEGPKAGETMDYQGTISKDGKTASGTMTSLAGQAPWSAVIRQ